jgi:uncharacterized protein
MLIDVNLLVYAALEGAAEHDRAAAWLSEQLNGDVRVGIPWECVTGFLRLATNPRIASPPIEALAAWATVESWLSQPNVWTPMPTDAHTRVLGDLVKRYRLTGKQVPDGNLVALAIEHGLDVYSADADFARFSEIRWRNPLA